jgi:hypothetical protein
MSKLAGKTIEWLKDAEQKYIDGMPAVTDENRKRLMQIGLDAVRDELQRRTQKKSVEPSANQGQLEQPERRLPTKEELQAWEKGMEKSDEQLEKEWNELPREEKVRQHREFVANMNERHQIVIAKIENPEPITVPVVEMEFKDAKGNIYTRALDQADILSLLKTYFKRVAVSPKMEAKRYSEAYGSDMGKMVYKLFQGWNTIYNETQEGAAWPPMEDVFPGLGRASQPQKVNAEILWRWASNDK